MRIAHPRSPIAKAWSGSAARADALRYAGGDLSTAAAQSKYKSFFLVCDGDPANVGSYKFPYKRLVNGKPTVDPDGLRAAKAAAGGARSGKKNPTAASRAKKVSVKKRLKLLEKAVAELAPSGTSEADNRTLSPEAKGAYVVTKSLEEDRYTFGPMYTPGEVDAHNEYTSASALQKAMWAFVRAGNRTVNKQHDESTAIGEVVDCCVWPYEQEVELQLPGREVRKATLPAGTAYVGVVWTPEAWPAVKGGSITGYSMGGRAMRVQSGELLPPMRKAHSSDS